MRYKVCPNCGGGLGDRWCKGRKLQQYCTDASDDCGWKGELRTPEKRKIIAFKDLWVDTFHGWDFIIYDRFGHEMVISQTHPTEKQAVADIEHYLKRSATDKEAGPYTAVLFHTPAMVRLEGRIIEPKLICA